MLTTVPFRPLYTLRLVLCLGIGCPIAAHLIDLNEPFVLRGRVEENSGVVTVFPLTHKLIPPYTRPMRKQFPIRQKQRGWKLEANRSYRSGEQGTLPIGGRSRGGCLL